ncbi:hypothetical protein F4809DRAFT_419492 [Biscogniauxia mediterranea]|nr:hypothetical protein F4809DRAFT_419492 [Biscogniauxia mediterranea]
MKTFDKLHSSLSVISCLFYLFIGIFPRGEKNEAFRVDKVIPTPPRGERWSGKLGNGMWLVGRTMNGLKTSFFYCLFFFIFRNHPSLPPFHDHLRKGEKQRLNFFIYTSLFPAYIYGRRSRLGGMMDSRSRTKFLSFLFLFYFTTTTPYIPV